MVNRPGGSPDPRRIRRLKSPRSIDVEAGWDETPTRVRLDGGWQEVHLVRRPWLINQHWWRTEPVSRIYYRISTEEGPAFTVYRDLIAKAWARQEY